MKDCDFAYSAYNCCVIGDNGIEVKRINKKDTHDFEYRKDRHESLGKGKIGIDTFKFLIKDKRFQNIPKILETPIDALWFEEIEMLKKFAG